MNRVPLARRVQIINALVEGNSIRSTERMTGTHRDTICRLLVEVGDGCAQLMDEQMRELPCRATLRQSLTRAHDCRIVRAAGLPCLAYLRHGEHRRRARVAARG